MSCKVAVVVLGLFGTIMAVPLEQPYDPQDFYPSNRIVGGSDAPEGSAPHMVALVVGDMMASLMCGGSLISQEVVLTAAHCIEPMRSWTGGLLPSARGVLGTNKWFDERRTVQFSGYDIHPKYNRWTIKNDIGVIRLTKNVTLDKRVQTIGISQKWVRGGEQVYANGWGTTVVWGAVPDKLQLLHMEAMSPAQCEYAVKMAQQENFMSPNVSSEVEICTMHKKGAGYGMCHGDSGSAIVNKLGLQVALVSWGWPCALGNPDIQVRISAFLEYLAKILKSQHNV